MRRLLWVAVGLVPLVLLAATVAFFVRTGDPMVFTFGGLLAAAYVVVVLALRRGRRPSR